MKQKNIAQATLARPIPDGFSTITPFLVVEGAAEFLEFIEKAFDAKTTIDLKSPNGQITHASGTIGDSKIMVTDAMEGMNATASMLYLYVEDMDAVYEQALQAGGKSLREPADEFYGDRAAGITDKWNNQWWIATHIEDVEEEELYERAKKLHKQ